MCRSKADPRGYYRCVPSQEFLSMSSSDKIIEPNSEDYIRGAFWHDGANISTIGDIIYVQNLLYEDENHQMLGYKLNKTLESRDKLVQEYCHLGNMISSVIDSRISNFNEKILNIQTLVVDYNTLDESNSIDNDNLQLIEQKITENSLSLGYELQVNTWDVLREINSNGYKIDESLLVGHKDLIPLAVDSSSYFPPQWNSKLQKTKRIRLAKRNKRSSYVEEIPKNILKRYGTLEIAKGHDGIFAYPDLTTALTAKNNQPLIFNSQHEILHEMTHMYEKSSPYIGAATESFLFRRITNSKNEAFPIQRLSGKNRIVYADSFSNIYTGTVYNEEINEHREENEILARGTESVLLGANGSLIGLPQTNSMLGEEVTSVISLVPDIEHRNLTLGILAGVKLEKTF